MRSDYLLLGEDYIPFHFSGAARLEMEWNVFSPAQFYWEKKLTRWAHWRTAAASSGDDEQEREEATRDDWTRRSARGASRRSEIKLHTFNDQRSSRWFLRWSVSGSATVVSGRRKLFSRFENLNVFIILLLSHAISSLLPHASSERQRVADKRLIQR